MPRSTFRLFTVLLLTSQLGTLVAADAVPWVSVNEHGAVALAGGVHASRLPPAIEPVSTCEFAPIEAHCDGFPCDAGEPCRWLPSAFRLDEFNVYPTFSYLDDRSASYVEFEFATHFEIGPFEAENRTVLNVADLPGTIRLGPANPSDDPTIAGIRASGFGDVLNGTFLTPKNAHQEGYHLGIGPVWTFPTATDEILGGGKYTVGPGMHFSTEIDRLTAGFFVWQSWSFAGDSSRKRVNQTFGKPFFIYEATEDWHLVSIPLGLSYSWEAKAGEMWTLPLGGGVRKLTKIGDQTVGIQAQAFDYVLRKPADPEWELRFTIEFLFDD